MKAFWLLTFVGVLPDPFCQWLLGNNLLQWNVPTQEALNKTGMCLLSTHFASQSIKTSRLWNTCFSENVPFACPAVIHCLPHFWGFGCCLHIVYRCLATPFLVCLDAWKINGHHLWLLKLWPGGSLPLNLVGEGTLDTPSCHSTAAALCRNEYYLVSIQGNLYFWFVKAHFVSLPSLDCPLWLLYLPVCFLFIMSFFFKVGPCLVPRISWKSVRLWSALKAAWSYFVGMVTEEKQAMFGLK